jgi:hypothetical protein
MGNPMPAAVSSHSERKMFKTAWAMLLLAAGLWILPSHAQTFGVAVQVSNGKRAPTQDQLETILNPGDFVRDVLGWHKADPHCDLTVNPKRRLVIPDAMMTLYERVAAAGGRNFVTLAFNNRYCGQIANSGAVAFPDTPALRAEFAAYAAEVAREVPALGGLSIWNELNGTWKGGDVTPAKRLANYCLLANAVITEVRKVNRNIPIAIGATKGTSIDEWFIEMFDKRGCMGKGDPTIWLDVHPYLRGKKSGKPARTDWQIWRAAVTAMRQDGISNPLVATEWGAKSAVLWENVHPGGSYMVAFTQEVLSRDKGWAGAMWYQMLYDKRTPNAGLYNKSDMLTDFGVDYLQAFRNR